MAVLVVKIKRKSSGGVPMNSWARAESAGSECQILSSRVLFGEQLPKFEIRFFSRLLGPLRRAFSADSPPLIRTVHQTAAH